MLQTHFEKPPTRKLTNYPYEMLHCFGLAIHKIKCQLLCSYKLAKVCETQQYNIAFNSKQLFLKEGDLYIITPEHNQTALSFAIIKISECRYQYLTCEKQAPFSRPSPNKLIHCFTLPAHQYCSHSHVHPWALHLPTLFTSGQTDVSQIGLELVNWITHTYCIHAVGLCFPLGHAAEHQCHSEELMWVLRTAVIMTPRMELTPAWLACSCLYAKHPANIQCVSFQTPFVSLSSP